MKKTTNNLGAPTLRVTLILSLGNQLWNYGAPRNPAQRGDEIGELPRPAPRCCQALPRPFSLSAAN
jgi:hypothetical protein